MAYSSVEIIAIAFALGILLKLLIVFVSRNSWEKFVKSIYSKSNILVAGELILSAVVFYYLLQELNIVQIFACLVLGALLTGMTFAVYSKELIPTFLKVFKSKDIIKRALIPLLVWIALAIWVLIEIF